MDVFSKEPSRAALLNVTELTLSMDNINGIVDISISSSKPTSHPPPLYVKCLFYASEAGEEWMKNICRVSDMSTVWQGCKV